jgi:Heavy-metal-associated domain
LSCALEVERTLSGLGTVASIEVDADTSLAVIVPASGQHISVTDLNAALGASPYRVTALHVKG